MLKATVSGGGSSPTGTVQFTIAPPLGNQLTSTWLPLSPTPPNSASATFPLPPLPPGLKTATAAYSGDDTYASNPSSNSVAITIPAVYVTGSILTVAGNPISGVSVTAQDLTTNDPIQTTTTNSSGGYSIEVTSGDIIQVLFPPSYVNASGGQPMALKSPPRVYLGTVTAVTTLPNTYYELSACQLSGVVQQQAAGGSVQPLSGVTVSLLDPTGMIVLDVTTTDAQGNFCFSPEVPKDGACFIVQVPATLTVGRNTVVLSSQGGSTAQTSIPLMPDTPTALATPFVYTPRLSTIIGQVTNGETGLSGISVKLSVQQQPLQTATTDSSGFYTFSSLAPGSGQLLFPATTTDQDGAQWELQSGQAGSQKISILAGQVVQAAMVAYQPEQHTIEQLVLMEGSPAENVLVDVRPKGAQFAIQSQRTGSDGKVTFVLPEFGFYEVRVYPDPSASGGPQVNVIEVNSNAVAPTVNIPSPGGAGGGRSSGRNGDKAAIDLQAYPVLTQDFSPSALPSTTGPAQVGTIGGTSALGLAADKAIREVLSWRTKGDDPKGFLGALNQVFDLKEVEGHTEWTWTPRSYTVQTDLGAVTGAQASIYTRAKVALDQSIPLLDGLYALIPYVEQEDLVTVQAVVRSQFTALVNEFGVVGGPRVPRVDELFQLLLGPGTPSNPEDIKKSGSLGLVRQRFGLERRYVTTVDDEQNLTNYLILVDYVIGLKKSWDYDKTFFVRTFLGETERRPFFGTQLVLLSRALEVVTQGVQDAYYTMDSVFMGDAERQTAQLDFANLEISIPDRKGGSEHSYTFPPDTSGLFVAELLDWVYRAASEELPSLLQDAGKDGLESFTASTDRLRKFVHAAIVPPQNARGLPPGYYTPRVKRALQLLADGLDEAYSLAFQVRPPEFPAELTPEELRRIRQALAQTESGTSTPGTQSGTAHMRTTPGTPPMGTPRGTSGSGYTLGVDSHRQTKR
jgi:Bacterial Ig-like domain (group 3)/SdrD B-like domain